MSSSRTALVTGAGNGVGRDAARMLLDHGYTVIVHSRTAEQSWDAAQRLVQGGADPARVLPGRRGLRLP